MYNHRGTCEQWIKEGKGAINWTRLSCRSFAANAVRLQLHAGTARASMTGRWGQMRQTTTAEVRLDHEKPTGSGITRRAIRWFGCEQRRSQSNFVAAKPPGTEDQAQRDGNPGNVG
jgi:Transposase DDE domain group 1